MEGNGQEKVSNEKRECIRFREVGKPSEDPAGERPRWAYDRCRIQDEVEVVRQQDGQEQVGADDFHAPSQHAHRRGHDQEPPRDAALQVAAAQTRHPDHPEQRKKDGEQLRPQQTRDPQREPGHQQPGVERRPVARHGFPHVPGQVVAGDPQIRDAVRVDLAREIKCHHDHHGKDHGDGAGD